jgi:hypothetical protein
MSSIKVETRGYYTNNSSWWDVIRGDQAVLAGKGYSAGSYAIADIDLYTSRWRIPL